MAIAGTTPIEEQVLVDLSLWLARVMQYSASHPACAQLAEKTHRTLTRALAASSPLTFGVLAEDIVIGDVTARHPAIRARLAPHLHARGLLLLRFAHGVAVSELTDLVELLTLPSETIYDRGGIVRLAMERGIVRVQIEEIAHEVTTEERNLQKRRKRLRDFFRDMLRNLIAERSVDVVLREQLGELLEHPDIASAILEEDTVGIAEAAAGFALMVQKEAKSRGLDLAPKLRDVLLALAPHSKDRLVIGFPAQVGEFRAALAWAFEEFTESDLGRFLLPAVRAHAADLDAVLYAINAAVPSEGRRFAALRWLGSALFDLPADDPAAAEALAQIARPVAGYESFRAERECLQEHAVRAIASRAFFALPAADAIAAPIISVAPGPRDPVSIFPMSAPPAMRTSSMPPPGSMPPPPVGTAPLPRPAPIVNGRVVVAEVIRIAARSAALGRICRAIPEVVASLVDEGAGDGVVGVVRGLSDAMRLDTSGVAASALREVGTSASSSRILDEIDTSSASVEDEELADMVATVNLVVLHSPEVAVQRLETTENRKMRRVLLDALPLAGDALLPFVRARLRAPEWYVARNAVLLLSRCGGTTHDLAGVARYPNEKVRLEVARALRVIPPDQVAMDIAASYLTDSSHDVSQAARVVLRGDLLGVGAIATLEAVAADDAQSEELRRRIVETLGHSPNDAAAAALFKLIHPRGLLEMGASSQIRDAAAVALHGSQAPSAAARFEEALHSTTWRVRKACERAMGKT